MSNTTSTPETTGQRRARWLAEHDHTHTPDGHLLEIVPTQDIGGPHCPNCGRTIIVRADEARGTGWASGAQNGSPESWQHKIDCAEYEPHPDSIAGQPHYVPGPGRLGYNEPTA